MGHMIATLPPLDTRTPDLSPGSSFHLRPSRSPPTAPSPTAAGIADGLEKQGFRVLAVAAGPPASMQLIGLIALSDPPRKDSNSLISELKTLGVRTVMVTGDAPATAGIVARAVPRSPHPKIE